MANKKRTSNVTPEQVIEMRGRLTQTQAAKLLGYSLRQWQNFEWGRVAMSDAMYAVGRVTLAEHQNDPAE